MYQLLEFSNSWNNKKLSDLYKYIAENIKYSEKINNLINKQSTTPKNLDKKLE
jgi:hypothetical protein